MTYDRMNPKLDALIERLQKYKQIDYTITAYELSTAEAALIVRTIRGENDANLRTWKSSQEAGLYDQEASSKEPIVRIEHSRLEQMKERIVELEREVNAHHEEMKEVRRFADGRIYVVSEQIGDLEAKIVELERENKDLEARLAIAKDSQLRTYDGLAQKADRADELEAKLKIATEEIEAVLDVRHYKIDFLADNRLRSALKKIGGKE